MALAYSSLAGSKTRKVVTLTSGTSWTVPAGVTYVNATLIGAGGGGNGATGASLATTNQAGGGQVITTTVTTTPAASITYAIGAGGTAGTNHPETNGGVGGSTTFTGATTALGGLGGNTSSSDGYAGRAGLISPNGGNCAGGYDYSNGGVGGAGQIIIEYWV